MFNYIMMELKKEGQPHKANMIKKRIEDIKNQEKNQLFQQADRFF